MRKNIKGEAQDFFKNPLYHSRHCRTFININYPNNTRTLTNTPLVSHLLYPATLVYSLELYIFPSFVSYTLHRRYLPTLPYCTCRVLCAEPSFAQTSNGGRCNRCLYNLLSEPQRCNGQKYYHADCVGFKAPLGWVCSDCITRHWNNINWGHAGRLTDLLNRFAQKQPLWHVYATMFQRLPLCEMRRNEYYAPQATWTWPPNYFRQHYILEGPITEDLDAPIGGPGGPTRLACQWETWQVDNYNLATYHSFHGAPYHADTSRSVIHRSAATAAAGTAIVKHWVATFKNTCNIYVNKRYHPHRPARIGCFHYGPVPIPPAPGPSRVVHWSR